MILLKMIVRWLYLLNFSPQFSFNITHIRYLHHHHHSHPLLVNKYINCLSPIKLTLIIFPLIWIEGSLALFGRVLLFQLISEQLFILDSTLF